MYILAATEGGVFSIRALLFLCSNFLICLIALGKYLLNIWLQPLSVRDISCLRNLGIIIALISWRDIITVKCIITCKTKDRYISKTYSEHTHTHTHTHARARARARVLINQKFLLHNRSLFSDKIVIKFVRFYAIRFIKQGYG